MALSRYSLSRPICYAPKVTPFVPPRHQYQPVYIPLAAPSSNRSDLLLAGVALATGLYIATTYAEAGSVDYEKVREDIKQLIHSNPKYDDGSYGPVLVRLAWHSAGTYDVKTQTGGSDGATMRFDPESEHGANAGLAVARNILEPLKQKHPGISYSDLWILAGCVAIEEMGGPRVNFNPGRRDKPNGGFCPPNGRLPDASKGSRHIRDIFNRMSFNDQEIVALLGAHALGRCHSDRSGYEGPWTFSPTVFSNDFYVQLLERKWTVKKWDGPLQYEDESKQLMMTPADMTLVQDSKFLEWTKKYAEDEELFFKHFASAFQKLLELGVGRN